MNALEINKIVGAILVAALALTAIRLLGDAVIHPSMPDEDAYVIAAAPAGGDEGTDSKPAGPEPVAPLLATASLENGETVSKKCVSCHTFEKGGPNKIGPNLWNIVGRDKANVAGFSYSSAMEAAGGDWSYEEINKYLNNPRGYIPGNKMAFIGLKKVEDRAALIAWMRQQSDNPKPLP